MFDDLSTLTVVEQDTRALKNDRTSMRTQGYFVFYKSINQCIAVRNELATSEIKTCAWDRKEGFLFLYRYNFCRG